jgi:hypothetical protein
VADTLPYHLVDGPGGFGRARPILAASGPTILAGAVTARWLGASRFDARLLPASGALMPGIPHAGRFRGPASASTWRAYRSAFAAEDVHLHRVAVGAAGTLEVTLETLDQEGAPPNLDLLVGRGTTATSEGVECRSERPGGVTERCEVAVAAGEAWWVGVRRRGGNGARYQVEANVR